MRSFASTLLGVAYTSIAKDEELDFIPTTPRQMLIDLSERYLRELYGRDFFGTALLYRWRRAIRCNTPTVLVIEDSGFRSEIGVQNSQLCLIRLMRPGFDFDGDSRSYLDKPDLTLINDSTLEAAYNKTVDAVDYAINKWKIL